MMRLPASSSTSTVTTHGASPTTAKHNDDGNDQHGDDEGDGPNKNKAGPTGPCKPGWGYGDKNHCHSGPPGQKNKQSHGKHKG